MEKSTADVLWTSSVIAAIAMCVFLESSVIGLEWVSFGILIIYILGHIGLNWAYNS